MTCANIGITFFAIVIGLLTLAPNLLGPVASKWIIFGSAVVLIIIAWTGVDCSWCKNAPKKKR